MGATHIDISHTHGVAVERDPDQFDLFDTLVDEGARRPSPIAEQGISAVTSSPLSATLPRLVFSDGAEVVPFPLARRRRKVLSVATTLSQRKSAESQDRYWLQIIGDLNRQLRRQGIDEAEIARQLSGFHTAVGAVLNRWGPLQPTGPKGAA
jgi:hypothetical protein